MTSPDVVFGDGGSGDAESSADYLIGDDGKTIRLTGSTTEICTNLMTRISDYLSPLIFQSVGAGHMTCTDGFAEQWMAKVVQPTMENNGLCDAFGTLRKLRVVEWKAPGEDGEEITVVCDECVSGQRDEWKAEAKNIWILLGEWINESEASR